MRHPAFLLLLTGIGFWIASLLFAQQRGTMLSESPGPIARLVVIHNGDPGDWSNWGFFWDAGERRNGRVFAPSTGFFDPGARASELEESNKRIYLAITDDAWDAAIGPSETEILHAIAKMGYRLIEAEEGLQHPQLTDWQMEDGYAYEMTYWFERVRR